MSFSPLDYIPVIAMEVDMCALIPLVNTCIPKTAAASIRSAPLNMSCCSSICYAGCRDAPHWKGGKIGAYQLMPYWDGFQSEAMPKCKSQPTNRS